MAELMRLRIPRGWAISDNKFYDTEPIADEDGSGWITNWHEGFTTDLIWIQEIKFDGEKYVAPNIHSFHIDMDWTPANNLSGNYYAQLKWCTEDELIEIDTIESKDRFEVRDRLEFWMNDIFENYQEWKNKALNLLG